MKIGLINQLNGSPDGPLPAPTWESIGERASVAEAVGFDSFVFEDALLYRDAESSRGCWESASIAAALAASTSRIEIGPSVTNAPYRSAALTAKIAETIDEISGGRYIFGIGAGNTPDDYEPFGFPTDHRYSRFAEAIEIIHGLLKGSGRAAMLEVMERRLLRAIMTPAMAVVFASGLALLWLRGFEDFSDGWLHAKLVLVVGLAAAHGLMARWRKDFANGANQHSQRFYRIANEVPTVLMIGIVVLVVVKPF